MSEVGELDSAVFDSIVKIALGYYEKEKQHPVMLFSCPPGKICVNHLSGIADDGDKLGIAIACLLDEQRATGYVLVHEGWATEHDANADRSKLPMPSESPNRFEVLIFVAEFPDGHRESKCYRIDAGKVVGLLTELDSRKGHTVDGRFCPKRVNR